MEYLDNLLNRKVERERLSAGGDDASSSSSATAAAGGSSKPADGHGGIGDKPAASAAPRLCWLCNRTSPLRFRLQGGIHLCFTCFRASYLSLLHPIINTSARRDSDAKFLKLIYNIESERTMSMTLPRDELLSSMYGEIIDPQRASFVMSSSMMQQRRLSETQRAGKGGAAGVTASANSFWKCPLCTFVNATFAHECEACGFVNPGEVICPVCKTRCSIGVITTSPTEASSTTKCKHGVPHCIWNCRECGGLNTIDGDSCSLCHRPRYWACSQCTALHRMARGEDGLRYCPTCGAYNTPDDILVGQAKIDKETKYANMITSKPGARQRHSGGDKDHGRNGGDSRAAAGSAATAEANSEVIFGVNDTYTLEEQTRQKRIEDNEKRLLSRLKQLQITRNVQKTDGNCLFRALANQLFGQPRLHYLVRSLATAYMSEHSEDYAILFDGAAEWKKYLAAMKEQGTWGDELCLNAAARCFRVNIHVITSDQNRWHIVFQYDQLRSTRSNCSYEVAEKNTVSSGKEPLDTLSTLKSAVAEAPLYCESVSLFLAYLSPVHYDDITPMPVAQLQLGELLSGELNKRVKRKQKSRSASDRGSATSAVPLRGLPSVPDSRCGGRRVDASIMSRTPVRSPRVEALLERVRTRARSSNGLRPPLVSPTSSNATVPLVPCLRPQSGNLYAGRGSEPPTRPPPSPSPSPSPNSSRGFPSE
ncbi:putative OTU-like cysteine protease [Leishmania utingensis]|uniref:OTU-like cysteine protease n=1 Tax=Leishmania utingensis TaxID=653362 RepID=A0AAW2ZX68_9TRYP